MIRHISGHERGRKWGKHNSVTSSRPRSPGSIAIIPVRCNDRWESQRLATATCCAWVCRGAICGSTMSKTLTLNRPYKVMPVDLAQPAKACKLVNRHGADRGAGR